MNKDTRKQIHEIPREFSDRSDEWKSSFWHERDYCVHYRPKPGLGGNDCEKGVDLDALTENNTKCRPCILSFRKRYGEDKGREVAECEHFEQRSIESAAECADSTEGHMEQFLKTLPWISKIKDSMKGVTTDMRGKDECPICEKVIHWSWTPYNNHMSAKCETQDCVNFIE